MRAVYIILLFGFLLSGCTVVEPVSHATAVITPIPENATLVQLNENSRVYIPAVSDRWTISKMAPAFLIEERVHLRGNDLAKQGGNINKKDLLELVTRQLQNEELFIYNDQSHAYLTIDLVKLKKGGKAPNAKIIRQSAIYGLQSLESEEGVTDVDSSVNNILLAGVDLATMYSAHYRQRDSPVEFRGIIGFQNGYWLFLYYTDLLRDSKDLPQIEQLLQSWVFEFK
ncbi:MAG: hypothetical protein QM483_10645 [Desulfuromusa sp.]